MIERLFRLATGTGCPVCGGKVRMIATIVYWATCTCARVADVNSEQIMTTELAQQLIKLCHAICWSGGDCRHNSCLH